MTDRIVDVVERELDTLGFELVELERAGSKARPILRIRIDRPDSTIGQGVGLDDCARASRALEAALEADEMVPERYVLEVSSPGVERPLVRRRDFDRFRGREVAVHGTAPFEGGFKRVEGELLGLVGDEGDERIAIRTRDRGVVELPRAGTKRVHLVHRWGSADRRS